MFAWKVFAALVTNHPSTRPTTTCREWSRFEVEVLNLMRDNRILVGMDFREDKAAALAAIFLGHARGEIEYLKLLKLMYLSERESLRVLGSSITGDILVSTKHGPVLSSTYDPPKENWEDLDHWTWEESFVRQGYRIQLWKKPSVDEILSPFEISLADNIWKEFGSANQWELVDWIHATFPEWRATTSAVPIEREEI